MSLLCSVLCSSQRSIETPLLVQMAVAHCQGGGEEEGLLKKRKHRLPSDGTPSPPHQAKSYRDTSPASDCDSQGREGPGKDIYGESRGGEERGRGKEVPGPLRCNAGPPGCCSGGPSALTIRYR